MQTAVIKTQTTLYPVKSKYKRYGTENYYYKIL